MKIFSTVFNTVIIPVKTTFTDGVLTSLPSVEMGILDPVEALPGNEDSLRN